MSTYRWDTLYKICVNVIVHKSAEYQVNSFTASSYLLKFINENKFDIYYISIIRFRPRKMADLAAFSYVWACLGV